MKRYLYNLATDKSKGFIAGIIKVFLFALSLLYGLAVRTLSFMYSFKCQRINCKVISVGNITLGGTGKTPLVEVIAGYLKQQGHRVTILTRGYKRMHTAMGDEPYMLEMNLADIPVIVDADRIRSANRAIRDYDADTVILDDGFQQWRIKKDLEIATIDATNPFGNRHMIPRGILRQPLSSLKRADVYVLTKTNLNPDIGQLKYTLNRLNPSGIIIESIHKPRGFYDIAKPEELFNTETLKGKTVSLFSGIGDPGSFEDLIIGLGINIGLSFRFADHHNYTREDLDKIIKGSKGKNIDTIITTQKDAARIYSLRPVLRQAQDTSPKDTEQSRSATYALPLLVLRIELAIKDEQIFYNRLLRLYPL